MEATELEGVLNAHAYLRVERPPTLWAADVDLERFIRLLGEMISAGLVRNGHDLANITLNVSNVTVEAEHATPLPAGDFVAVTVGSPGDWSPESTWPQAAQAAGPFVNDDLETAAANAGAAYGYTRDLGGNRGSVTILVRRG